jgi:hypothetical protein
MDFDYEIIFNTPTAEVRQAGVGMFYPHDGGFNLEYMLWLMAEQYGRPTKIEVVMNFTKELAPTQPPGA